MIKSNSKHEMQTSLRKQEISNFSFKRLHWVKWVSTYTGSQIVALNNSKYGYHNNDGFIEVPLFSVLPEKQWEITINPFSKDKV